MDDFADIAERLAAEILAGSKPTHDGELLDKTATTLWRQVERGYGKKAVKVQYNAPDFEMIKHLEQSVYSFSAAKSYHELKDMTAALMDGDRLRTPSEFRQQIETMNLKYNSVWLATEQQTAIAGGQMASRWVDFEQNKDAMPMLRYSTVGDGKVRDSHRALDGVTKVVDDVFWNTHYPPNGWNCRCDVLQLPDSDTEPTREDIEPALVQPMFQTNLAKQGLIFPQGHPYFTGIPKPELRRAMAYLPPENSYKVVAGSGKKAYDVHLTHNIGEIAKNLAVADDLVALGYKNIRLLPDLHEKEAALKRQFYPEGYRPANIKKNPDAWMVDKDGRDMVCDFKTLTGRRSLASHISEAAEQANYAVIKLMYKPQIDSVKRTIERKMGECKELKGVIVIGSDGKLLIERLR